MDRGDAETFSASDGSLYCGGVRVETEVEVEACCDVSSLAYGCTTGGVLLKKNGKRCVFAAAPDLTVGLQIQQQTNRNLSSSFFSVLSTRRAASCLYTCIPLLMIYSAQQHSLLYDIAEFRLAVFPFTQIWESVSRVCGVPQTFFPPKCRLHFGKLFAPGCFMSPLCFPCSE